MEEGMETCPCRRVSCPRHGDCVSCREHPHTPVGVVLPIVKNWNGSGRKLPGRKTKKRKDRI